MRVDRLTVGMLEVNCFLLWDEDSHSGLIVDPGDESERIAKHLEDLRIAPKGILLTHGHVDHIQAVPDLSRRYDIDVSLHSEEQNLYFSPRNELPPLLPAVRNLPKPGDVPRDLPGLEYEILFTPGHTSGGVCYYFPKSGVVFTGDTLFKGGVGRTDLIGGDHKALMRSIHDNLLDLAPPTIVYPGHGPQSTIAYEKAHNPFL